MIDEDSAKGSADVLNLPPTVMVLTGGGGRHFYFRASAEVANSVGSLAPGVDVRGDGGQVVAAGSIHPETRREYTYAPGRAPWEIEIAELPAAVLAKLQVPADRTSQPRAEVAKPTIAQVQALLNQREDVLREIRSIYTTALKESRSLTADEDARAMTLFAEETRLLRAAGRKPTTTFEIAA